MKVRIVYSEIQHFENIIEVEMTKKEYQEYLKMSEWDKEQKYDFTARTSVENGNWVETEVLPIKIEILDENKAKTKITTNDFSIKALQNFNSAVKSKSFIDAFDFARYLIDNDYPVEDVKEFMKANFKDHYQFLDYSI
jgi:hypothetical protein